MPNLHRRVAPSINMEDLGRAPLLGQGRSNSSGSDSVSDNEHDTESRDLYGSTSTKSSPTTAIHSVLPFPGEARSDHDDDDDSSPRIASQGGVQQADAINQVWSRTSLIIAYIFIFFSSFANALQWQVLSNLMPFVVSDFSSHSLIPTIAIVSNILSGVLKLPVAKLIDSWGRAQGFACVTLLAAFGLMLMSQCENVETYAAAQVLYQVGISGVSYILDIIIADTSSLKNRTLAFAFSSTPNLLTAFIGPVIAGIFNEHNRWRWAFAVSAIFLVVLSIPLFCILILHMRKARRLGLLRKSRRSSPWSLEKLQQYFLEFDVIGMATISAGMTLILVPLSLTNKSTANTNLNAYTATISLGVAFLVLFVFHERNTEKPFLKFSLLCSRNVAGACLLSVVIFVAYFAWDGYYTSYLQVVHGLNITEAGYIGHIYGIGSSIWAFVVGYLIRRSDRFKWLAVAALPVHILGGVLMIFFRRPDTHIVWVILCQILITIGGSTLVVCDQMAVMSVAKHTELASVMAILSLSAYIGSAVGSSLSGAIWNSTLPGALAEMLPNLTPTEINQIASDLKKQLSYPMGSATRDAIITAYGISQIRMCIAGSLISLLEIAAVFIWSDRRVSLSTQVAGTVL
ncbi:MFS general substrate transporter [Xylariaceae sp. FL1019]|nr:MFS general substrate transporter [Xylariaceae sp. FL1019]